MTTRAPLGTWTSPITADVLTTSGLNLSEVVADGDDLYWLEGRPTEGGRVVLVRLRQGEMSDVTPAPLNVRTRVHEYGGGAYDVRDEIVVFSNFADGRLHIIENGETRTLTPEGMPSALRFGDLQLDLPRRRVLCVREDHRSPDEVRNELVAVPLDAEPTEGEVLVTGHDFVAAPRLSPDGDRLAWISWEHPCMPWDSTLLWVGDPAGANARVVDGGEGVSVCDIGWCRDGSLLYLSDRSGYWNLTCDKAPLHAIDRDCSDPAWMLGGRSWLELPDGRILFREWRDSSAQLMMLRPGEPAREVPTPLVSSTRPSWWNGDVVMLAERASEPAAVIRLDPDSARFDVLRASAELPVDRAYLPEAEAVTWQDRQGREVHGFLYRPRNPQFEAPEGELAPLVVQSHGGPTGQTIPSLDLGYAYLTSRGIAVLDVNYGGSAGYGRAYRERLKGQWGIVDVDDCCDGALAMAERGWADPERLAISGGSAGGYTTLSALAFRDVFAAGVSLFGVADLEALARDTHKFESRYLDGLVGPYPAAQAVYVERSPINHLDALNCAMLLLQGEDDEVVPPNQATAMADAVRRKGKPVAILLFAGEGHGFRAAENQRAAYEAELSFYGQVFGFEPANDIPRLPIDNL
ncbi:MAG: S9 family peptidase [Terracoccus sp.]